MSVNTLKGRASKTDPFGRSWNTLSALNQFLIPLAVSMCKRAWNVPKKCEWHHAWHEASGNKKTHTMEEKEKQQCISQDFPRKTAPVSQQVRGSGLWEPLLQLLSGGGEGAAFQSSQEEWFPNYDFWELKRGNDLFVVNVKHMVFSEGSCLPCSVISLTWERQSIKI